MKQLYFKGLPPTSHTTLFPQPWPLTIITATFISVHWASCHFCCLIKPVACSFFWVSQRHTRGIRASRLSLMTLLRATHCTLFNPGHQNPTPHQSPKPFNQLVVPYSLSPSFFSASIFFFWTLLSLHSPFKESRTKRVAKWHNSGTVLPFLATPNSVLSFLQMFSKIVIYRKPVARGSKRRSTSII